MVHWISSQHRENFAVAALKLQIFCITEDLLYTTGMNVINKNNLIVGLK